MILTMPCLQIFRTCSSSVAGYPTSQKSLENENQNQNPFVGITNKADVADKENPSIEIPDKKKR